MGWGDRAKITAPIHNTTGPVKAIQLKFCTLFLMIAIFPISILAVVNEVKHVKMMMPIPTMMIKMPVFLMINFSLIDRFKNGELFKLKVSAEIALNVT